MSSSDPSAVSSASLRSGLGRPLSPEDFVVLNDEIRAFVRAGIPLDLGLRGTAGRTSGSLRGLSERLAHRLELGTSFDDALAAEGEGLPAAYRAVLTAGLRTGRLEDVLSSLSELAESTSSLRRQLRLSLIYPAIVFILAYGLFTAFVLYVVPQLQRTYAIFDMRETAAVKALLWLHRTAFVWGIAVPLVVLALIVGGWVLRRIIGRGNDGLGMSRWIPAGRDLALARFSRVLSLLVAHHVPLPEACRLSGESAGDATLNREAHQLATTLEAGQSLQEALAGARSLPPFLRWLIRVGERQGSLATSLRQAAAVYEQRALGKLEWFSRVVPPVTVVLCCGTITLLYGMTLFLPLSEMIKRMGLE